MAEYHKIQTVYKRDPDNKYKTLLEGEYSLPEFEYLANNKWSFTEKVDGTNIRIYHDKTSCFYRGRSDNAQIPAFLIDALNYLFPSSKFEDCFGDCGEVVLYGEGYGAKIQKGGGKYSKEQEFILFDVTVDGWVLNRPDVEDVAKKLGLNVVPIIGEGTLHDMVALAKMGLVSLWGDFQAEGIVARPATELRTRAGHRVITKIKCKDFPTKSL